MENSKITIEAKIKADKSKVWDYYTSPAHIVNWNFADPSWHCPSALNDLKVGGTYLARMEAKDGSFGFDFEAVYTAIEMGQSFTYLLEGRYCDVTFDEQGDETLVTVSFDPETENPIELQREGWQAILNNFKAYTENA